MWVKLLEVVVQIIPQQLHKVVDPELFDIDIQDIYRLIFHFIGRKSVRFHAKDVESSKFYIAIIELR